MPIVLGRVPSTYRCDYQQHEGRKFYPCKCLKRDLANQEKVFEANPLGGEFDRGGIE